jgi:hypothetical protein
MIIGIKNSHMRTSGLQFTVSANDYPRAADLWRNVAVAMEG